MTNREFLQKLNELFDQYPIIKLSKQKSLNELIYVLRMSDTDYQISLTSKKNPSAFGLIPSVKETFVPSHDLAKKIISVTFDEEAFNEYGINVLEVVTV